MDQNKKSSAKTLVAIGAVGAVAAAAIVGVRVAKRVRARNKPGNSSTGGVQETSQVLLGEVEMNETHMALADPARRYMR